MRLTHPHRRSIAILAITLALSACMHVTPESSRAASSAAEYARSMVGIPYKYGGATPRGFDCSGLAYYSYARAGVAIPRESRAQRRAAQRIELAQARPGDLLFFDTDWNRHHVAIYIGANRFVHAPSSGKHVTIDSLDDSYFGRRLVGVGRFGG